MTVLGKGSGFFMDYSLFQTSFAKYAKTTFKQKAKKGAFKAGSMIIQDALKEEPKVPREIGDLQASHVVKPDNNPLSLKVTIGFNKEYAAKLHEAPDNWNWTLPGSGPKYLSTPLSVNKEKYAAFIAMLMRTGQV